MLQRGTVRNVGTQNKGAASKSFDFLGRLFHHRFATPGWNHVRARFGQAFSDGPANTGSSSHNDGNLPRQIKPQIAHAPSLATGCGPKTILTRCSNGLLHIATREPSFKEEAKNSSRMFMNRSGVKIDGMPFCGRFGRQAFSANLKPPVDFRNRQSRSSQSTRRATMRGTSWPLCLRLST